MADADYGKKAYNAYGDAIEWVAHDGQAMLAWSYLPEVSRRAWAAAESALQWNGIAREGYEAYAVVTGGLNFRGEPMPQWLDLPDKIRSAWNYAAVRVCDCPR